MLIFQFTDAETVRAYHRSSGVLLAVVLSSQPQHVLRAVKELGEPVELTVAEVDGSLEKKTGIWS